MPVFLYQHELLHSTCIQFYIKVIDSHQVNTARWGCWHNVDCYFLYLTVLIFIGQFYNILWVYVYVCIHGCLYLPILNVQFSSPHYLWINLTSNNTSNFELLEGINWIQKKLWSQSNIFCLISILVHGCHGWETKSMSQKSLGSNCVGSVYVL